MPNKKLDVGLAARYSENTMSDHEIVPADRFEIRKVIGVRLNLDTHSYCIFTGGWGVFDLRAQAFVSIPTITNDGRKVLGPWTMRTKRAAKLACSEGLILGYTTVKLVS